MSTSRRISGLEFAIVVAFVAACGWAGWSTNGWYHDQGRIEMLDAEIRILNRKLIEANQQIGFEQGIQQASADCWSATTEGDR